MRRPPSPADVQRAALAVAAGSGAAVALVALYLGIVSLANSPAHAVDLLWGDRYFVGAIAGGFGVQAGLVLYIRLLLRAQARAAGAGSALAATGMGTSTAAMIACCAHHMTDALPVLGLSGAAIFLDDYRTPIMFAGLAFNLAGIVVTLRVLLGARRRVWAHVGALAGESA